MTPAERRTNLILLGIIVSVSVMLFLAKVIFVPSAAQIPPVVAENPAVVSEKPSAVDAPGTIPQSPIVLMPEVQPRLPVTPPVPALLPSSLTEKNQNQPDINPARTAVPAAASPTSVKSSATAAVTDSTRRTASPSVYPASSTEKNGPTTEKPGVRKPVSPVAVAALSSPKPVKPIVKKHTGSIIFVFDDAGHNLKQLEPFLKLPFPCTIAVLPGLQYSTDAARKARAAGKDVILHQPMQAINLKVDPGPGAIKSGMSQDQIRALVRKNLAEVGPVVGLNNHEGSLITADTAAMEAVFDVVREKKIYFLDSRTNAKTVAPAIARERGMTIWERAVFLDNTQDRAAIIKAVNDGLKVADKKGSAIMIGHIWSNQLADILTEMYPELVSQGYSLSTIAKLATSEDFEE